MIIFPYKASSVSAKLLSQELGVKRMKAEGSKYSGLVINWGSGVGPKSLKPLSFLNKPEAVSLASNKIKTFEKLTKAKVNHVPWTKDKAQAQKWLEEGATVIVRTSIAGHSGKGIVVCSGADALPDAPLYTRYVKKRKEFRVHVVKGQAIDVVQKRKQNGVEADPLIRSHLRGWVFCRENVEEPASLREVAVQAVQALGLDFGAVDIIWNEAQNKCYVLEINTAPGIEGTTVKKYADAFKTLAA